MILELKQLTSVNILESPSNITPKALRSDQKMVEMNKNSQSLLSTGSAQVFTPTAQNCAPTEPLLRPNLRINGKSLKCPSMRLRSLSASATSQVRKRPHTCSHCQSSSLPHLRLSLASVGSQMRPILRTSSSSPGPLCPYLRFTKCTSDLAPAAPPPQVQKYQQQQFQLHFSNFKQFVNHLESPRAPRDLNQTYQ